MALNTGKHMSGPQSLLSRGEGRGVVTSVMWRGAIKNGGLG